MKTETRKSKYQRYESYKDSGIEWLGEIPSGWELKRLKYLTKMNQSTLSENHDQDQEIQYVDIGNVNIEGLINPPEQLIFRDAPSRARRIIKDGDVIIGTVRTYLKAIAHFERPPNNLIVSTGFAVLTASREINSKYLYFFVASEFFISKVVSHSYGVSYPAITPTMLGSLPVLIPSNLEQIKIVEYLDLKINSINQIIEKKKQLIALLKEKRSALINKAVTKGLDDSAELVDSGVEWIGEIPKDWEIKDLKYITKINQNTLSENYESNKEIKYVDIGNVNIEGLVNPPEQLLFKDAPSRARRIVKDGDVIIGTVRTYLKAIAHFDKASENLIASTGFAVLTASKEINSKYLYFFVASEFFISQVVSHSYGVSYPAITPTILGCLPVLMPNDSEQVKTLGYLIDNNCKITHAINKVLQSIELLEEYKQSLITKVVKGEIKVQ